MPVVAPSALAHQGLAPKIPLLPTPSKSTGLSSWPVVISSKAVPHGFSLQLLWRQQLLMLPHRNGVRTLLIRSGGTQYRGQFFLGITLT